MKAKVEKILAVLKKFGLLCAIILAGSLAVMIGIGIGTELQVGDLQPAAPDWIRWALFGLLVISGLGAGLEIREESHRVS